MNKIAACGLAFVGFALAQLNALAWSGPGHLAIAAEAFRQLPPELRAQAVEVLKAHPDYARWTNAYRPNPTVGFGAYVFMRASTWPDEIRRNGSPYDHPNWHFIDYPLRPPAFPLEPGPKPTDDILFGISQCETTLRNTNAAPELRAAYLSWLIHLVGDIHQPLHCSSLFTAEYPKGDRGGNDFFVRPAQAGVRLHGIWDGLLGSSPNPQTQWKYAIKIEAEYPRAALPELRTLVTPKDWSLESRGLAITRAYLDGNLKGGTNAASAPSLPEGYAKAAKAVAERQAALAGYRLAAEIERYLKFHPVPLLPANTYVAVSRVLPDRIGTAEASRYYDEDMVVTGKVVEVSVRPSVTILDFDKPYPNTPFTAVVFQENAGQFTHLAALKNQAVEVSGAVTEYRGKPEIILESPNQIKMVNGK